MGGFALVLTGLAALGAVFAWLVLSTPKAPELEPEPVARPLVGYCPACGHDVTHADMPAVVEHLRGHAEADAISAHFTAWEQELTS